jgi:hypothetical protein
VELYPGNINIVNPKVLSKYGESQRLAVIALQPRVFSRHRLPPKKEARPRERTPAHEENWSGDSGYQMQQWRITQQMHLISACFFGHAPVSLGTRTIFFSKRFFYWNFFASGLVIRVKDAWTPG